MLKKIRNKYFKHFIYFYNQLGYRIFISIFLSLTVGLLDGFGLLMFLPLLEMIDGGVGSSDNLGNLSFIVDWLAYYNISLTITVVLTFLLVFFILKAVFKFIEGVYSIRIQQFFNVKLRTDCIDNLSNFSYKSFTQTDAGKIQNTFSGEVARVSLAYRTYFATIQNISFIFVYFSLALLSNPRFTLLVILGGVLTSIIFKLIYIKTKKLSANLTFHGHKYQGLLIQSVTFFKYLKSSGQMIKFSKRLKNSVSDIENEHAKIGVLQTFLAAIREPLVIFVIIVVILIQVNFFSESLGNIILSLMFFYRSMNFVMAAQTQWNGFLSVHGSLENMIDFQEELKRNADQFGEVEYVGFKKSLMLNDIFFAYSAPDWLLRNINLEIFKNTTVAFIGESGSGKTTLVNVLSGLLPLNEGKYMIDGVDSTFFDLRTFQNRIGYITQEPVIFDDNIFNNVTFWDEKTPENLIKFWEALRKASIHDFVEGLPEKENAPLGNNGVMVSGGQKQRLSIARELYKDIDILIMDEATSALDSETEKAIQENIDALKGQYTIIIIAHRLSTIKNADEIVLMAKGEINDKGSFSNLMQSNETFKRMVNLQEL